MNLKKKKKTHLSPNQPDPRRVRFLHVFPSLNCGGAEIRIIRTINKMGRGGGHAILSIDGSSDAQSLLDPSCGVKFFQGINIQSGIKKPFSLWKQIAKIDPKVLLTYNWGATDALIAARIKRFYPVIHNECGLSCDIDGKTRRRQIARRFLLPHCEKVVVTAESFAALASDKFGVPKSKIAFIRPGVDTKRFFPSENTALRRAIAPGKTGAIVVTIGSLTKIKRVPMLIKAFARTASPHDRLAIFGEGPERPMIENLICQLGVQNQIYLHGYIDAPEEAFNAGDIYATATAGEAASNSLLEGMSCELPVVTTDVGDNRVILSEANREYATNPNDQEAFTDSLKSLLADKTLRNKLGTHNRERVCSRYSADRLHSEFHNLWLSVEAGITN